MWTGYIPAAHLGAGLGHTAALRTTLVVHALLNNLIAGALALLVWRTGWTGAGSGDHWACGGESGASRGKAVHRACCGDDGACSGHNLCDSISNNVLAQGNACKQGTLAVVVQGGMSSKFR